MGETWSKFLSDYCDTGTRAVGRSVRALVGRKRKRDEDYDESAELDVLQNTLNTPKRKKLISTAQYIYQALFKEGKNSDVTVYALGKAWRLHKVYLCQSPYFSSMFSGSWKETTAECVHIKIVDPKITLESLSTVLGSLYQDEIVLEPREVVSTLAAATLFQLEGIIEKCAELMIETLNTETAVLYYEAACEYGLKNVKEASFRWLLVNLLCHVQLHPSKLRLISVELMTKLVSDPDLFVMQTEFSLYVFLRYWVYLQIKSECDYGPKEGINKAQVFFQEREGDKPFLLTKEGSVYSITFRALRLRHMINHHLDVEMLKLDRIIPEDWLGPVLDKNWLHVLQIDQGFDRGPEIMELDDFKAECLRCGRVLANDGQHIWRWTGYCFGIDLVWSYDSGTLKVKRSHRTEQEMMLSMQQRRHFLMRITLASLNEQRQVRHTQTSGLRSISMFRNEEVTLLALDRELKFPLLLSVNLVTATPIKSPPKTGGASHAQFLSED
ncbi:protein germ cell-less [Anabrus simplex]|uniref:protein germ cell-less n=1 Tax=Anabrus simplex TaxID=316456 RepID=UPI0034DD4AB2